MEHLYIFDYCTNRIIHIKIHTDDDAEDVMNKYGFKLNECTFMHSETELELEHLN